MSEEENSPADPAGHDFAAAIAAAQAEIGSAVERGGLRDDPFRYPLAALATVLGTFPALIEQVRDAAASGSQVLSPESLERIEAAASDRARRAIEREAKAAVQASRWRSIMLASGAIVLAAALGGAVGYWRGYDNGSDRALATANGLQQEITRDPHAAADWLRLMRANDIEKALAACRGDRINTTADGQTGCALPLWITPAPVSPPSG